MSNTSPSWSTARHRYIRSPAIRTTISSRCQRSLGRGRRWRSRRDRGAEFQHPAPYGLVGDLKPAVGQQFLDIAVAQGEAEIEPDRVLDHLGREAMTAVAERSHTDILPDTRSPNPVSVTMPYRFLFDALDYRANRELSVPKVRAFVDFALPRLRAQCARLTADAAA